MQANRVRVSLLRKPMVQTLIASLICILLGLLVGYVALAPTTPSSAYSRTSGPIPSPKNS